MEMIRLVIKEVPHYDLFKIGSGGSLLAVFAQLIYNPNLMLTTLATLAGIAVAGLSAYKVWLEIKIKKAELKAMQDLHNINKNQSN